MGILDIFRENKGKRNEQLGGIAITKPDKPIFSEPLAEGFVKQIMEATTIQTEVELTPEIIEKVGEKHPYNFSLYEQAYLQVPIIHGAINKTVDFTLGPGFYIDSDNEAARKKIEQFMEEQDFDTFLRIITRNMLIYGCAFVEIVAPTKKELIKDDTTNLTKEVETKKNKGISQLVILDPKYIFVKRDKHGKIEGYTQYRGKNNKAIDLSIDEIAYFPYNQIGEDVYGTSMLRPLFGGKKVSLLTQFLETEEAMKTIVKRRANTPIQVQVGTDEFPATSTDVQTVADQMVDITAQNEFVTSHTVNFNVLGYRGRILDIRPYLEHYENNIIYGLEVPAVLLGRANVPEGLANVQMTAYERRIKSLQSFIEKVLESQILRRIVPNDTIEFEWGQPTAEMEDIESMRFMNILKTPMLSDETRNDVENLLRKKIGLEAVTKFTRPQPMQFGDKNGNKPGKSPDNKDKKSA